MKYYVTLSARDHDGTFREVVISVTESEEEALEQARNLASVLPKERYFGGPVSFVLDEAGAIVDR